MISRRWRRLRALPTRRPRWRRSIKYPRPQEIKKADENRCLGQFLGNGENSFLTKYRQRKKRATAASRDLTRFFFGKSCMSTHARSQTHTPALTLSLGRKS